MALPLYLAQTAAEMGGNSPFPDHPAYMACMFSPYTSGISNPPPYLPPRSMLILSDQMPMDRHDPAQVTRELSALMDSFDCESLLLDFQRPGISAQRALAECLIRDLDRPVGVSEPYAAGLSCPVFLPPLPPDKPLAEHIAPWKGREIWLEAALEGIALCLTVSGCTADPLSDFPESGLRDEKLHCHYTLETEVDGAVFRLWRTEEDLDRLLSEAEALGVTRAIGLWQELGQ